MLYIQAHYYSVKMSYGDKGGSILCFFIHNDNGGKSQSHAYNVPDLRKLYYVHISFRACTIIMTSLN